MSKLIVQCLFRCTLSLLLSGHIYCQENDSIPEIFAGKLQQASENYPAEEIYIQTSKGIYETGEDLWFKGYVLLSQYLMPSAMSRTMYVQLLQMPEKKPVWEEKYTIENGFVDGHIYIQDSLSPGKYVLIAQTPNSLNHGKNVIESVRKVEIIHSISALQDNNTTAENPELKSDKIDFNLMPEGGHLVSGMYNKVAFKAVDQEGNPQDVSGTLYEGEKPFLEFKSLHAGMGDFSFVPDHKKNYHIELEGIPTKYVLPEIEPEGQVLQLWSNTSDTLALKVTQSLNLPEQNMYRRIQIRGVVYAMAEIYLESEKLIKIPVREFPRGIAEVTLFNQNLEPVSERLAFVNQNQKLNIKATTDKKAYLTRDKVKLKIQVTDKEGAPVSAHLGLSVYDKIYNNPKDPKTIESHYLLSTSLRGRIYDPGYYFNPEHTNGQQALDLLLLTQGWWAYEWGEHNLTEHNDKKRLYLTDTLIGKVNAEKRKAKELQGEQFVMAFSGDSESDKTLIEVDSLGRYVVLPEYLQQEKRGYKYFKLLNDTKKLDIQLDESSFKRLNKFLTNRRIGYPLPAPKEKTAVSYERLEVVTENVKQLDEVVLTDKNNQVFRDKYMGTLDSLAKFEGNNDYVAHGWLNCPVCSGENPVEGKTYTKYIGNRRITGHPFPFNANEVKKIVYEYPKFTEEELLKKYNLARLKGYYPKKEFYSPKYDKRELQDDFLDFRNTLYWKPNIITNAKGEAQVEFYTSDLNTSFKVTIEGISGEGILGRKDFKFRVRKAN
jgi:hypothetical protein